VAYSANGKRPCLKDCGKLVTANPKHKFRAHLEMTFTREPLFL
jgi:hypothetical protein